MHILITGGAGFIGSNFIRYYINKYPEHSITNLDKLTYAGNLNNLKDLTDNPGYKFIKGDIADPEIVKKAMAGVDVVINFAAETHVDRSILDPEAFLRTDIFGPYVLLEQARKQNLARFIQISTDEVYGSIEKGAFTENSPLNPSSPYSASKASGDLLVRSYFLTYNLPVIITRASNNFGPYQYPEKLIPLFILNAFEDKKLPLYGDGLNVRNWLYVIDHCKAIDLIIKKGLPGEIYNIGGATEYSNIEITRKILRLTNKSEALIQPVKDRPGHDRRYSLNSDKLTALGWQPEFSFEEALKETVNWYKKNKWWWEPLRNNEYWEYYRQQYSNPSVLEERTE